MNQSAKTPDGIPLSTFAAGTFSKVPAHQAHEPARSFDLAEKFGPRLSAWLREDRGLEPGADLLEIASHIPMRAFAARATLDELCKVKHQTRTMMDASVEDAFKTDPTLNLIRKVGSSAWRWGCGRPDWNETVDAYEGIRSFGIGHPAFSMTFDHTTGYNERGYSEHSRTFLDGALAFLVHYKGAHVLTIGFSLMDGHRLLLQQVQAKARTGNRWLFKLPGNLLERVIDRLAEAFPRHGLYVADGADLMRETLQSYRSGLARARDSEARELRTLARDASDAYAARGLETARRDIAEFAARIAHAEADAPRIAAAYREAGRFELGGKALKVNGIRHYEARATALPLAA